MSMLSAIRLNISNRLQKKAFRRRFFRQQAQDDVAQQIRTIRIKREMRQVDLAKTARMKQSAVSRVEQANYSRWTFTTLLRIADALDARVRVIFDPYEDVIKEYEQQERQIAEMAYNLEQREKLASLLLRNVPSPQLPAAQNESDEPPLVPLAGASAGRIIGMEFGGGQSEQTAAPIRRFGQPHFPIDDDQANLLP